MQFFFVVFIFMGYWWAIKCFCYLISKKDLKEAHIVKFRMFERYIKLLFFIQFWCFLLNVLCRVLSLVCNMSTRFPLSTPPPPLFFLLKSYFNGRMSSCSHSSWIYNYLCNQCLSPLTLWVWIPPRQGVLDITFCAAGRWFSPVSSTSKTDCHDITEIL